MKAIGLGLCLAAAMAIVALLPALAAAGSGYTSAYAGWVSNGTIQSVNGDNVVFTIPNGSGSVHVTVQSTSYTTAEVTIEPGNSYTYWDGLLISVVQLDSGMGRAYVDIERPTVTPTPSPSGTKVYCDTPGQLAMAGDTVTFPITIVNYDGDHVYALSASNNAGWTTSYNFNGKDINQIYVPEGGTRTVNLVVKTSYTSQIDTQTITASVDGNTLGVTVQITSVNS
ncbi:MAG TPA: alpha-galactosidase, partial [Methanocella sp.]|nr:alpha-galactosidase [Methanocella sp.]